MRRMAPTLVLVVLAALFGCAARVAAQPAPPLTEVQIIAVRSAKHPGWEGIDHGAMVSAPVHGGAWLEAEVEDFGYSGARTANLAATAGVKTRTTNVVENGRVTGFRHVFRFDGLGAGPLVYEARSQVGGAVHADHLRVQAAPNDPAPKAALRVALYRWIPDAGLDGFASMLRRIEAEFEARHPEIDLDVSMPPYDILDDYDPASVAAALGERFDVIEIDTLILPDLVKTGEIGALEPALAAPSTHPAALAASAVDGVLYGAPHLLCTNVIISRSAEVAAARSAGELRAALDALGTTEINLVGDWLGDWTTASLYLDALADSRGAANLPASTPVQVDPKVATTLKSLFDECRHLSANPCLDGSFDDNDVAARLFGWGGADAVLGYTERLHPALRANTVGAPLHIGPATLGDGDETLLFTDSFVVSAVAAPETRRAAEAFIAYMLEPATLQWILLSKDAPWNPIPRYLLPSRMDLRAREAFASDPYYPRLFEIIEGAAPFPAKGMFERRKALAEDVMRALVKPADGGQP